MRRLPKVILLIALVSGLIATPVLAWIVNRNNMAEVSGTVLRAEASWELIEIQLGEVNSGDSFAANGTSVLTIENAETLYVAFAIYTLTEDELAALESLNITIGEDTNGDGEIDNQWQSITISPPSPFPTPFPLSEGVYNVVIVVEGVAGYPDVETPIDFVIEGECATALP